MLWGELRHLPHCVAAVRGLYAHSRLVQRRAFVLYCLGGRRCCITHSSLGSRLLAQGFLLGLHTRNIMCQLPDTALKAGAIAEPWIRPLASLPAQVVAFHHVMAAAHGQKEMT